MEMHYDHVTMGIIAVTAILTTLVIIIDATLLFRTRKTGVSVNLGTYIDGILLFAGLLPLTAFYSAHTAFHTISKFGIGDFPNEFSVLIPGLFIVKICGILFVMFFYAWAVLRIFYDRFRMNNVD